jgi:hypothetical protein
VRLGASLKLWLSDDLVRVNRFNLREAGEISHIESHDLRNAVRHHHGGKPRVMDLNAAHAVRDQKLFQVA